MSKLIENIKRLARMVKNETKSGGNTAMRVGGLLEEIGEELENKYDRTETDLLLSGHDTADSSHRNIQDRFDREMDGLDLSLTEKINQADQKQTAAIAATNETLAAHSGNQATHKTSQQIRGEIVDADIPASLARVADVESRDAAVLQTARQHTDSSVSALGNDVYRKTETYTRTETDDRDTAVLQTSRQHTDISVSALGNDVYRKAETYTRAETDSRDAAVLRDSKEYVVSKIAEIVDGSPAALNTLCEIANAINNDPNFATSIMTVINGKADTVHSHAISQIDSLQARLDSQQTADTKDNTATFTEASVRDNIISGEKLSVVFGKIRKWFSSLGTLAFRNTVVIPEVENLQSTLDGKVSTSDSRLSDARPANGGISASCSGNAATAARLQNVRTINGTPFDGTANITIAAAANGGNADTLDGFHVTDLIPEDKGGIITPADVKDNRHGFGYIKNGWPANGSFISFCGFGGKYSTQIQGNYGGTDMYFRTYDSDKEQFNPWMKLYAITEMSKTWNVNNIMMSGIYRLNQDSSNLPAPALGGIIEHFAFDDHAMRQVFYCFGNGNIYHRRKIDGIWQQWRVIADSPV